MDNTMELKVKQYNASMSLDIELNNGSHCATQYVSSEEDRVKLAVDLLKGAYEVLASTDNEGIEMDLLDVVYDMVRTLEDFYIN